MAQKPTILIADDDGSVRRVLTVRCRHLGFEVRTAPDAMMALTLIHKDPPTVIMLDISMPAGNGVSVLEMVRSDRRLSGIPVIVHSGEPDEDVMQRCRKLDAHFVPKSPDAWEALKPLLSSMMERASGADRSAA